MLLAMDIGNNNIKTGLFKDVKLCHSWRLATDRNRTADEYGIQIWTFLVHLGYTPKDISGIIFSSVVPSMNYTIEHMCAIYFQGVEPMQVRHSMNTGLKFLYDYPQELGSDRICNAVASRGLYGGCCITVDFGTATTFGVLTEDTFLGGMICPGFKISTNALIESTAMLPKVEYIKPERVIGTNTAHCIQSGILYGYVGQLEYLVKKAKDELSRPCLVIGTGGMGELIASETDCIDILNPTLTLSGLAMLYKMNSAQLQEER